MMDAKYLEEIKARCEKMDSQQGDALGAAKWEVEMHSMNDIPELLAEVERLKAANAILKESTLDPVELAKVACELDKAIKIHNESVILKEALLESTKCFNCSRCIYGRGKDCGKRPHENCADVFIRKAQEAQHDS